MKLCFLIINSFLILLACGSPTFIDVVKVEGDVSHEDVEASRFKAGKQAAPGEWPYQGYLRIGRKTMCGCSLISRRWAITAVHCTIDSDASELLATFGMINRIRPTNGVQSFTVARKIEHPDYTKKPSTTHDICLLYLTHAAVVSNYVQPIPLPPQGFQAKLGEYCTLTGWGTTKDGSLSAILLQASVPLISNEQCHDWLGIVVRDTYICAGLEMGGVDTCQGDSGGPLACYDEGSDQYYLQGITSFGYGCAQALKPGVYTRVSSYSDWVKQNTENLNDAPDSRASMIPVQTLYRTVSLSLVGFLVGYTLW